VEARTSWSASYKPIRDYAAIGNLRTAALVGVDGSIDWCCLPDMAGPSVFAALLDRKRGGRFAIAPPTSTARSQTYVDGTNVLETRFDTERGRLVVTDFMPLDGHLDGRGDTSRTEPALVRMLVARGSPVDVELEWSPRFDYARATTRIERAEWGAVADGDGQRMVLAGLPPGADVAIDGDGSGPTLRARFTLRESAPIALVSHFGADPARARALASDAAAWRDATVRSWRAWLRKEEAQDREWAGEWGDLVRRSELALKLLVHADSGALAAAGTTSLP
jgi:GH15 family glucan-1,4-alpha-glucosidase